MSKWVFSLFGGGLLSLSVEKHPSSSKRNGEEAEDNTMVMGDTDKNGEQEEFDSLIVRMSNGDTTPREEIESHHHNDHLTDDEDDTAQQQQFLVPRNSSGSKEAVSTTTAASVSFSVRWFSYVTFILLVLCHVFVFKECTVASARARDLLGSTSTPLFQKWILKNEKGVSQLPIHTKPKESSSKLDFLYPGQVIETMGNGTDKYHFCVSPIPGFVLRQPDPSTKHHGKDYFQQQQQASSPSSFCPLLLSGIPKGTNRRYQNAPMTLVMAQQFWNALQVLHLYLLIMLLYEFAQPPAAVTTKGLFPQLSSPPVWMYRKWIVRLMVLPMIVILPFSVYVTSPGGHIFAFMCLILNLLAMLTPVSKLRLSVGEHHHPSQSVPSQSSGGVVVDHGSKTTVSIAASWVLTREETIACICNLGSSLYNYAGSNRTWPHWLDQFHKIDAFFGWTSHHDSTFEQDFTMGIPGVRFPLYVPRVSGTPTGAQQFWLVWSIHPFMYVTYFGIMMILSSKSPGKWIQRILCGFGMFHFLFLTDLVSYRYGRGLRNESSEFAHWAEKWAWRIAILLPIYQNCTNGHWENGHKRFPLLGRILRMSLILWAIYFFAFQVFQSDVFRFTAFLRGQHRQVGLIHLLNLDKYKFFKNRSYPYRFALVTMWSMYGLLHVVGFTLFKIILQRDEGAIGSTLLTKTTEEGAGSSLPNPRRRRTGPDLLLVSGSSSSNNNSFDEENHSTSCRFDKESVMEIMRNDSENSNKDD